MLLALLAPLDVLEVEVELVEAEPSLLELFELVLEPSDEPDDDEPAVEAAGALAADVLERESVMYQPLPLNTMPTG